MDQQQQPGQFNPGQYDFIMNHQAPKKSIFPSMGGNKRNQILIMVAAALLFVTIAIVIFSLIFGGGGGSKERLVDIAVTQTELVRVAEIGTNKATGTDAKSLAASVQLTLTSDKASTLEQLKKNGDKVKDKELIVGKNSTTDEKLTTAEQNGTFDAVFTSMIAEMLQKYQVQLEAAHKATSGKSTKQTLAVSYENAGILVKTASLD